MYELKGRSPCIESKNTNIQGGVSDTLVAANATTTNNTDGRACAICDTEYNTYWHTDEEV